jgi:hypothetical protein
MVSKCLYINSRSICYPSYGGLDMLGDRVWKGGLFRWWRKTVSESKRIEIKFAPQLKINRHDGAGSLDLLLVNDAGMTVWVEEALVVLADLDAIWQTAIPTCQTQHEIRQNISAEESLELSLVGAIYDAAGRPQGRYSCLISVDIRCRVGDEWFNKTLGASRIEMNTLKVLSLRHSRWYEKRVIRDT